jgi:hypothetical protein
MVFTSDPSSEMVLRRLVRMPRQAGFFDTVELDTPEDTLAGMRASLVATPVADNWSRLSHKGFA